MVPCEGLESHPGWSPALVSDAKSYLAFDSNGWITLSAQSPLLIVSKFQVVMVKRKGIIGQQHPFLTFEDLGHTRIGVWIHKGTCLLDLKPNTLATQPSTSYRNAKVNTIFMFFIHSYSVTAWPWVIVFNLISTWVTVAGGFNFSQIRGTPGVGFPKAS